jgi:hypothetical protein
MDENLNIAVGPRTYNVLQQALDVSPANDRNLFVNADGSPIGKGEMTRVAKLIKVPGIMTDELTGQKLDTLQEAYDLRRMWVTLALNEFPGQGDRVGAAQGRAIGAVTKSGGAVKEYYSPSRGFYGKEATTVPNVMDQWLFEARTDELPADLRPPEGQRVSYATDFVAGNPVFEPADAPITMGDLTARYVEPAPKTEVVRPEGPATVPEPAPVKAGPSPELEEQLGRNNLNLGDIIKNFGKTGLKVLAGAVGVETARQIVTEPAAFAAETAMEVGARAVGLGAAPAAAIPMIMQPTATAGPELSEIEPGLGYTEDELRQIRGTQPLPDADAGFVNRNDAARNREEAAAAAAQPIGFLSP